MPRPRIWAAVVAVTVIGLGGISAVPASAHDELVSSTPTADASLPTAPAEVALRFSATLKPEAVQLAVVDASGNSVREGTPTVEGATVKQTLKPNLPAATYRISYRVISRDGHPVSGVRSFTIQAQPGAPSTTHNTPDTAPSDAASGGDQDPTSDNDQVWIWLVAGGVAALGALAVVVVLVCRRRAHTPTAPSGA